VGLLEQLWAAAYPEILPVGPLFLFFPNNLNGLGFLLALRLLGFIAWRIHIKAIALGLIVRA